MSNDSVLLGVDIGGTKVAAGVVDAQGKILSQVRVPMVSNGSAEEGFACVKNAIDRAREGYRGSIDAIGVSSPGPLDPRSGVVINPPNLSCWRQFPLKAEIERAYGLPASIDNDGNAAGLAEALWGAAKGYSSVFYLCIGTGIGTGIIFDGRIYHGRTGAAAEGGHMVIDYHSADVCGCGKRGCIESMASGPAIARRARAKAVSDPGRADMLLNLSGGDKNAITAEVVEKAWKAGDPMATQILEETMDLLTVWLGSTIDVLEPDVIVVGGGVGELASHFFDRIESGLPKWSINQRCCEIPLKLAHYRADSGIAGGAALCCGALERASAAGVRA